MCFLFRGPVLNVDGNAPTQPSKSQEIQIHSACDLATWCYALLCPTPVSVLNHAYTVTLSCRWELSCCSCGNGNFEVLDCEVIAVLNLIPFSGNFFKNSKLNVNIDSDWEWLGKWLVKGKRPLANCM